MSFDRRTGKPIAVSLVKMEKGTVHFEILSENRVNGTCMLVAQPPSKSVSLSTRKSSMYSYIYIKATLGAEFKIFKIIQYVLKCLR